MESIQLFSLASRQADWLSLRQEIVAGNIANANTPKFTGKDVVPFKAVLESTQMQMARTNPGHISASSLTDEFEVRDSAMNQEIGIQESGNNISISQELTKTGEIKRQYELNTSLVSSFHRMMLMTVRK